MNRKLREVFAEHQIYRIDHYLGKEDGAQMHQGGFDLTAEMHAQHTPGNRQILSWLPS